MLYELIVILAVYGLTAGAVHIAALRKPRSGASAATVYVLYVKDDQRHVEWAVYSLLFVNWLKGAPVRIVLVDEGSSDDSLTIMRLLSRCYGIDLLGAQDGAETLGHRAAIHVRLHCPDDWRNLPELYSIR